MNEKMKLLKKILSGSKEFSFSGSTLILKSYYTGETINLDLSCIDEEMLEQLFVDEEDLIDDEW